VFIHGNRALSRRRPLLLTQIPDLFLVNLLHFPSPFSAINAPITKRLGDGLYENASPRFRSLSGHRRNGVLLQRDEVEEKARACSDAVPEHVSWDFARIW